MILSFRVYQQLAFFFNNLGKDIDRLFQIPTRIVTQIQDEVPRIFFRRHSLPRIHKFTVGSIGKSLDTDVGYRGVYHVGRYDTRHFDIPSVDFNDTGSLLQQGFDCKPHFRTLLAFNQFENFFLF